MQTSSLSERMEAAILEQVFSDDELENRVRSLLRWKICSTPLMSRSRAVMQHFLAKSSPPWTAKLLRKPFAD